MTGERQTRSRPFPCDECSKLFTRNENLQRHKRARHHGPTSHDFECDRCHAGFSRSDVFKRHRDRCQVEIPIDHSSHSPLQLEQAHQANVDIESLVAATELPAANTVSEEGLWDERSPFNGSIPQGAQSSSPMDHGNCEINVKNYFEHFHPSLPLLHRPTFAMSAAPNLLLKAIVIMGSLFSTNAPSDEQAQWRNQMWQSGQQDLRSMVFNDCGEIRQPWVMQAWILYMIYGIYTNDAAQCKTARQMLRQLVDAVREIGLSQQEIAMPESQSWLYDPAYATGTESQTLYSRWASYVTTESMRLSLYTLIFLDSHAFLPCNSRPLMSSMELGWELPFPASLWEAKDPEIWIRRFNEYFGVSAFTFTDDLLHRPRGLATASLTIATQNLMTETPGAEISSALEVSPFATFCVLTNLETLVRDFTRCYYQMPPSYSDPNPFHILTQNQTKSFHMAIRNIGRIVKKMASASDGPHFFLWRTNELFIVSLKVNLCRPDRLLIGGIVDNSLIAGMAASTHLTQGNFVAIRRSAPLVPLHFGGNEGVLALISELSAALSSIFGENLERFDHEAPWVTVTSYGILLCIWEALRRATTEINLHIDTFNDLPKTSEPCMLIFNSLMESTLLYSRATEYDRSIRDPRLWSMDREVFSSLLEDGQSTFANLIKTFCQQSGGRGAPLALHPALAFRLLTRAHLNQLYEIDMANSNSKGSLEVTYRNQSKKKMTSSTPRVGWYGLGSMGLGMSLNLQNHFKENNLPPLRYSNRTLSKGNALRDAGAVPGDFGMVVQYSDVIFTMISTDDVLIDLLKKVSTMGFSLKGKIFVDSSTVHPETAKWAANHLNEIGASFIAAPVFGASPVAAAGALIFAVAGPHKAVETVRPLIINIMGRSIIDMGEDVRKSSLLKISGNILVISFMEVIAEAQVFAEVTDIGTQQMEEFIGNMFGLTLQSYSRRITSGAYAPPLNTAPGFAAALASKDMKHALSIADSQNVRLHTLETASKRLNTAREYAGECLDSSAIYGVGRMEAGLPFWSKNSRQGNEPPSGT